MSERPNSEENEEIIGKVRSAILLCHPDREELWLEESKVLEKPSEDGPIDIYDLFELFEIKLDVESYDNPNPIS